MRKADFNNANISNTKFTKANLKESTFLSSSIEMSNFEEINGYKSFFQGADIAECDFSKSIFHRGGFIGTSIRFSKFDDCNFLNSRMTDLSARESSFKNVKFNGAFLRSVRFVKCDLTGATFENAWIEKDDRFLKNIKEYENIGLEKFYKEYKITGPHDTLGYFEDYYRIERK